MLFDLDELQQKYSKYAFNQLYRCVWIDDADSIFTIKQLLKCSVDIAKWKDFDPRRIALLVFVKCGAVMIQHTAMTQPRL